MAKQTFTTGQVLTAAQMTSLQQTAMLGGAASAKTASYTLVAADAGTAISMSSASATTITVNTALFAAGDTVQITNLGVGVCTITAGTATVNTSASLALAQYESGTLDFTSTSAAIFIKGAGASASSSGLTFITSTTFTNSTGSDIDSIFSSSYENYLVVLDDLAAVGGGAYIGMQFRYSTTTLTTNYYTVYFGYGASNSLETNGKNNGNSYVVSRVHTDATAKSSAQFFVSGVGNTSENPTVRGQFSNAEGTTMGVFGGRVYSAQTFTGIRLISDAVGGGSNISGRVTVYGLAKA
jgi:peptidyl-tRNA hydrolase